MLGLAKLFIRAVVLSILLLTAKVQAEDGFSYSWTADQENLKVVGAEGVEKEYTIGRLSVRGGLYHPGERVALSLVRPEKPSLSAEGGSIEAVAFNTAQFDPTETGYVHPDRARRIARTTGVPVQATALASFKIVGDEWSGVVELPDAFGMYALLLKRGDGKRTVVGSIARVPKPQPRIGAYRQIMAEWALPGGYPWARAHDDAEVAKALARAGIGLVRREIQSGISKPGDLKDNAGSNLDGFFAACRAAGIQVMVTAGCHQDEALKEAGCGISRQLPPSYDPQLTQWYANFARRHWSGGDSGLWAIEHFNEPWEPEGISGWNSDSQRYRQILKCLYDGAKSVDKRIKIAGTCSVMNTEDKLLSGDSRAHVRMLDLMTDHYVSIFAAYGPRLAERHGVVSGETETWGAHSQVLVAQFMTQFLSNGQKWVNPAKESVIWQTARGIDRDVVPKANEAAFKPGVVIPTPTLVALAVWSAMIQDREFNRLAFTGHLPYLYQFGKDADARLVLCGKVTTTGSGRLRDYPWWQVLQGPVGSITIADPGKAIEVRDLNGNPLPRRSDGRYRLTMDTSVYYLWSPKGAATVIDAVRAGVVVGARAVHIAPGGVQSGVSSGGSNLPVELHNVLNRPVSGRFSVESMDKQVALSFGSAVDLPAGSTVTVQIPVPGSVSGGLPLNFSFTPAAQELAATAWTEVVQTTVISRATPGRDAKAWAVLPGATVLRPQGEVKGSEIEAVWLPFVQKQKITVATRRGEVKLAYDDKALHLFATVDAKGIHQRPRLATRDDSAYFWSQKYADSQFGPLRPFVHFLAIRGDGKIWGGDRHWVPAANEPGWKEYQELLAAKPDLKRLVKNGSAGAWAASLGGGKNLDAKAWAANMNAGKSFDEFNYAYLPGGADMMDELPFMGDSFQFAIDVDAPSEVMTKTHDLIYPADTMPARWTTVPDSDYEFALYQCSDGKPELWCLLAPGVPRGHYFPRQERGKINQHAVKADCSVAHADGRTVYRASIPWSELGGKPWSAGSDVGFTFSFNAADGGNVAFGEKCGATKTNTLSMHPYWLPKASNSIRWTVQP